MRETGYLRLRRWPLACQPSQRRREVLHQEDQSADVHQEGGHPAGVPHITPPSSASGAKKASPTDPLENIANYRSAGWRKDLSHVLRGFYLYNYLSCNLGQHQDEWKTIKEETPLK